MENDNWRNWKCVSRDKYWTLMYLHVNDKIVDIIKRGDIKAGEPLENMSFKIKEVKKKWTLSDSLRSPENVLIVSSKLKQFLYQKLKDQITYHPVTIKNEDTILDSNYFIINNIPIVDCIDKDKSEIKFNPLDPNIISIYKKIMFKEGSIPEDIQIFRPKHLEIFVFVRTEFAEYLKESQCTGVVFFDLEEFVG